MFSGLLFLATERGSSAPVPPASVRFVVELADVLPFVELQRELPGPMSVASPASTVRQ